MIEQRGSQQTIVINVVFQTFGTFGDGAGGGIRTRAAPEEPQALKACPLVHSGTPACSNGLGSSRYTSSRSPDLGPSGAVESHTSWIHL